jgi:hypothetical protein
MTVDNGGANVVATTPTNDKLAAKTDEIRTVIERAQKGDETILPTLRKYLEDPQFVDLVGNIARQTERSLIQVAAGEDLLFKEAVTRKLELMRQELSGPTSTALERLLVERIVTCWLQLQEADIRYTAAKDLSWNQVEYHQRRINHTHKRFLSAVKTLATVRRLAVPVLIVQVNIAGKQVNKVEMSAQHGDPARSDAGGRSVDARS